ncbi:RecX family transcriptional regulator [Sphingomonas sp. RT2P30]|uniref:regulatory protein RecX n=1 Tax=Parasphingomonas halimpatiens TaxID=3096162 RepID=UPI002FCC8F34
MSQDEVPSRRAERAKRPIVPLDQAALERLALHYVERFSTTRVRLGDYLRRKIRERGWDGPTADPAAIATRLAALGYIDDRAFGEARARAMARRGLGRRRVDGALRQAGLDDADAEALAPAIAEQASDAALTFARRKRIGPFATSPADRPLREKQLGAMVRAGHDFALARKIVAMAPGDAVESLLET